MFDFGLYIYIYIYVCVHLKSSKFLGLCLNIPKEGCCLTILSYMNNKSIGLDGHLISGNWIPKGRSEGVTASTKHEYLKTLLRDRQMILKARVILRKPQCTFFSD